MNLLLKLLGLKEEMPLDWRPHDPSEARISPELDRRRELIARNDRNLARYLGHPAVVARFRMRLAIHEALGRRGRA